MERRYDLDVLRTSAFALLMFYHLAMVYVADWPFHIKSGHQWAWLQWPMIGVNMWRMSLLFLISGIVFGLARPGRYPWAFGVKRTVRLLLPLAFGMVAVVPIQAYYEAVASGYFDAGFATFMVRYLQFKPWPAGSFAGAEFGVTWNHLWYLAYLWLYCLLLLLYLAFTRRCKSSGSWPGSTGLKRWPALALLLLPPMYLFVCLYWISPRFPATYALFDDWFAHARYFPVFVFGYVIARSEAAWLWIDRVRWTTLALATFALLAFMALRIARQTAWPEWVGSSQGWNWRATSVALQSVYVWSMLLMLLAFARRWLNRPFSWLPVANRAVYPWYILHQSLIIPLAYHLSLRAMNGLIEFTLLMLGTIAGCALLYVVFIQRLKWLQPLFGLR